MDVSALDHRVANDDGIDVAPTALDRPVVAFELDRMHLVDSCHMRRNPRRGH